MKKTTIAAALLMVISTCSFAGNSITKDKDKAKGESTATIINSTKDNVYKLRYSSSTPGTVAVSILDAAGKVILVDYIKSKEGFIRPYNFQELSEGNYTIEVKDHAGSVKIPVSHKISVSSHIIKADVKALAADKKYELVMHGSFKNGVQVTIYNNTNEVVFSDFITENRSFSKVYDLSKIRNKEVTFEVRNGNKVVHTQKF